MGGSIFPVILDLCAPAGISPTQLKGGLTKRELFAAMAMMGLVANPERINDPGPVLVNVAIAYADALIKELEKDADT